MATRAQPTQQPLIAVMPQLHIWNVPPLPRPSASAPPATAGPLAATAVGDIVFYRRRKKITKSILLLVAHDLLSGFCVFCFGLFVVVVFVLLLFCFCFAVVIF